MRINKVYNSINFDIDFNDADKTCIFLSPSGTGITFLFNILIEELTQNGVGAVLVNSTILSNLSRDIASIELICLKPTIDVVILDNADLYLTQSFLDKLSDSGKTVILSIKDIKNLRFKDYGFYRVKYSGTLLNVRRKL